jgi:protein-disulfide isomerase
MDTAGEHAMRDNAQKRTAPAGRRKWWSAAVAAVFMAASVSWVASGELAQANPTRPRARANLASQTQANPLSTDLELLNRADASRRLGPPAAVVIEEFFDYACPTCAEFHRRSGDDLKAFIEEEQVSFVAHMYPLPRLMRGFQAAEAALCAGALGGPDAFFAMHDRVLRGAEDWRPLLDPRPVLSSYAEAVGVDMDAYRDCIDRDAMAPLILSDLNIAAARRITGTPTFIFRKADSQLISAVLSQADAFAGFPEALAQTRAR